MKFLVFLVAVVIISNVEALTKEQKDKIKVHRKICVEETGADNELVKSCKKGNFDVEDPKLKLFFLCMMKRVGVMNASGKFLKEVALAKIEVENREKLEKIIDICVVKVGDTPPETAWNYAKCFHTEKSAHGLVFDTDSEDEPTPVVEEKAPLVKDTKEKVQAVKEVKEKVSSVKDKAPIVQEKVAKV